MSFVELKNIEVLLIIDESGSMDNKKMQTIDAINNFINEQKKYDDINLTIVRFSYRTNINIVQRKHISKISSFDDYNPDGQTALHQAVYTGMNHLLQIITKLEDKNYPKNVLVSIFTDGEENNSLPGYEERAKNIIKGFEDNGWEVVFNYMGREAKKEAEKLKVKKQIKTDDMGTLRDSLNKSISIIRTKGKN